MDIKKLKELADDLFGKKSSLNSLHQEIADHFYVERADFTLTRSLGSDFGAHLMNSFPLTCRRELGNQFSTMLRPTAKPWFHVGRRYVEKDKEDTEVKQWLEWFEETQRRAMYDKGALFTRATKEGDHDFAAFGQTAISVEMNKLANGLLYRCWHLRDMAWQENEEGKIGFVARKWKPTAQNLQRTFGDRIHQKVKDMLTQGKPFETVECYHLVLEADMYDEKTKGQEPRWSIYYDCTNEHLIAAQPIYGRHYIIPRWQTVSGSQYAYSPATVCALPDARLLQAMTFTLLEAGEKATRPPMIATQGVIKSDVALYAGGITWVDEEYDEKLGAALRPVEQDFRGFNYGLAMAQDTRALLNRAFFLDSLNPFAQGGKEETAFEVGQRVQKYIRDALPIFEPMEQDYNAELCDETFDLILRAGGFGDPRSWPKKLRGAEVDFQFESPLHDLIEQQKGHTFNEAIALVGNAIALDPTASTLPKIEVMLRDALMGIGAPAAWVNSEAAVDDAKRGMAAKQEQAEQLANMEQASTTVKNIGQSGLVDQPAIV
jgi:hypothetical protein